MEKGRREFLKQAAMASGGAGLMALLPDSLIRAMAIDPAKGSTYLDAEHVVFLMQENRSFDHTFGTLQGVRGFDDPRAIDLPDGRPVWFQQNASKETYAPFRLDMHRTRATWMSSLPHSWPNQVDARNNGWYDKWLISKSSGHEEYKNMPLTLGYHNREDIPFYYALADAFTVCDHNFCSSLTGTTPNRLFFWSGTIREKEDATVPACVYNGDADYGNMVNWKTFPERLEAAGIGWKVYQNEISAGTGLQGEADSWLANFTDNPLEFFEQYNVKLAPEYIANLPQAAISIRSAIAEKEQQLLQLKDGTDEKVQAASQLAWLRKALDQNIADQRECTPDKFNALPESARAIHRKAFTNNRKDQDYHTLESFTYKDGTEERNVSIPKGDVLHQFRDDVSNGNLPAVSWLVAPENFSDHPSAAWYGSWYISEVMKILTDNPEVWKKTIFVLTYDENDGYFDHLPPFAPPHPQRPDSGKCSAGITTDTEYVIGKGQQSSEDEDLRESPIGLGYRVPMVIASPWTRGGWVNSEVFDHTSSLQFLEKWLSHKTGKQISEPNISKWRRTICGDLTSVFREFNGEKIRFPKPVVRKQFIRQIHEAQFKKLPDDFRQVTNKDQQPVLPPLQEKGTRPANALAMHGNADLVIDAAGKKLGLSFTAQLTNPAGSAAGLPFTVYCMGRYHGAVPLPRYYAVAAGDTLNDQWDMTGFDNNSYHLRVYGVNGFFREFRGSVAANKPLVKFSRTPAGVQLHIANTGTTGIAISVSDVYNPKNNVSLTLNPGGEKTLTPDVSKHHGWHDLIVSMKDDKTFMSRYAGRLENGKHGTTDPLMGGIL